MSSPQAQPASGSQYEELGDGVWKESKDMGTVTEPVHYQNQETNTPCEQADDDVPTQEVIPPNESENQNTELTHLDNEDDANSDGSLGYMTPPQYAPYATAAPNCGGATYPTWNEQDVNRMMIGYQPLTMFYQPWIPSPFPNHYTGHYDLEKLVEFRQNLLFGSSFTPIWPDNSSYDHRDKFIPKLPLGLIAVESVVHYVSQPYAMSIHGNWVTGVAHIPMSQHICICLDNGYKRYEIVFRIQIIRSIEEKLTHVSNSLTTSSTDFETVSYRLLKSDSTRKPTFRSLLQQSLLANVMPLMSNVPFEFILGRGTGRCLPMDEVINTFMRDTSGFLQSHFYPVMQHLVHKVELKLPGASYLFTGHFFRPYLSAACILTSNGSIQLLENVDIRISFDQRRMFGLAYDSTLGHAYGHDQAAGRTKIGMTIMSACNYMEPGIRRWELQNEENQNPSIPPTCNPFIVFDLNPIFNPNFDPFLTTAFVTPSIVSCHVPSQTEVNASLKVSKPIDTADTPRNPACFGFNNSCRRDYSHLIPQFTPCSPHINGMIYPPVFFQIPRHDVPVAEAVEESQSSTLQSEGTELQIPVTKFNPNAQDFHPKGLLPQPPEVDKQSSQHSSIDLNNNNIPLLEPSAESNIENHPQSQFQQLNEGLRDLSFPTETRNPNPPQHQPLMTTYVNGWNTQAPVFAPVPRLNTGPFSLSLSTDLLESDDEHVLENEIDLNEPFTDVITVSAASLNDSVNDQPFNNSPTEISLPDENSNLMRNGDDNPRQLGAYDNSRYSKNGNEHNDSWSDQMMEQHVNGDPELPQFGNQGQSMNSTSAPYEYDNRPRRPYGGGRGRGDGTSPSDASWYSGRGGRYWENSNYDNNYRRYHFDIRSRDNEDGYSFRGRGRGRGRWRGRGRGGFSRFERDYHYDAYDSVNEQNGQPMDQKYTARPGYGKRNEEYYSPSSENVVPERPKNCYAAVVANGLNSDQASTSKQKPSVEATYEQKPLTETSREQKPASGSSREQKPASGSSREQKPVVETTSEESIDSMNWSVKETTFVNSQNHDYKNFSLHRDGNRGSYRGRYGPPPPAWNEEHRDDTRRDHKDSKAIEIRQVERAAGGEPSQLN